MKGMAMTLWGLLLAFSLTGCGGSAEPKQPAASSTLSAQSSESFPQESSESDEPEEASAENSVSVQPTSSEALGAESISSQPPPSSSMESPLPQKPTDVISSEEDTAMKMNVQIGNSTFTATLEKNAAASSFVELMKTAPVVIQMSDYSGFEKVGSLGTSLPASNSQTTTQSGDIVLYNGNQIVIFYGSNSWSYTRLGKIDDLTGWEEALENGDVTVTFSVG